MLKFKNLFESIEGRDNYKFCLKWNDSKGSHYVFGNWFEDHVLNVLNWAKKSDLEVVKFESGLTADNTQLQITIVMDSCGEDFIL